ncbi:MAG: beta-lactamase family protein [Ruminococcaceae bacterium]|nr:beta-lactamase family protein [Oscillospiraceae bacterium]
MNDLEQRVDRAVGRFVTDRTPGCALLLAKGGQVLYRKGCGMADPERGVPAGADDNFIIASNTKQFACLATLMLRDRGLLSLDEPIERFFPDFPDYRKTITVRMLMTHTSGIREYFENADAAEKDRLRTAETADVLDLIRGFGGALGFAPNTAWSYCNSGFVMLGDIVRQLTGKPFGRFVETEIFTPLGMGASRAPDDMSARDPRQVPGFVETQPGVFERQPYDMLLVGYADGNISSNVDDLLRWHHFLFETDGAPLVKPGTLREMFAPHRLADGRDIHYALGWFLGPMEAQQRGYPGHREIWHTGSVPGFISRVSRFPDDGVSAILLTNWDGIARDELYFAVLDELFRGE